MMWKYGCEIGQDTAMRLAIAFVIGFLPLILKLYKLGLNKQLGFVCNKAPRLYEFKGSKGALRAGKYCIGS